MISSKRKVVLVSRFLPSYVGGLGGYQRQLGQFLSESDGWQAEFRYAERAEPIYPPSPDALPCEASRFSDDGWKAAMGRHLFPRLASRPALHGWMEHMAVWANGGPRLSTEACLIHFTGTGWDMLGFAAAELAQRMKIPLTIWPAVHPMKWGDDLVDMRLYRQASAIFCQSKYERDHLIARGADPGRMHVCGLGPLCREDGNRERFRAKHRLGEAPVVLFLGNRQPGKGAPALLAAWPIVRGVVPNAVLVLAGPGSSEAGDGVVDLGVVDEIEKADALAGCDVFCLPSEDESFGIVYVEAWSYGRPVVCGRAPASRELVEDGVTGRWADQQSGPLAHKLIELLQYPAQARAMGAAGKNKQRSEFTWEATWKKHREIFEIAMEEKKADVLDGAIPS